MRTQQHHKTHMRSDVQRGCVGWGTYWSFDTDTRSWYLSATTFPVILVAMSSSSWGKEYEVLFFSLVSPASLLGALHFVCGCEDQALDEFVLGGKTKAGLQLDRRGQWSRWCYPPEMHRCVPQFQVSWRRRRRTELNGNGLQEGNVDLIRNWQLGPGYLLAF